MDVDRGLGTQTVTLAKLSDGKIYALDNYQPFLDQLNKKAEEKGVVERINIINGDMTALDYENGSFDLIWSEGAIFIIGFEKGQREWRRLLSRKGYLVVSELSLLQPNPPEEIKKILRERISRNKDNKQES